MKNRVNTYFKQNNLAGIKSVFIMALVILSMVLVTSVKTEAAKKKTVKGTIKSIQITSLPAKELTLKKGKTKKLIVKVTSKGKISKKVKFVSSNNKIITVSSAGLVKAMKNGKAKITIYPVAKPSMKVVINATVGIPSTSVKMNAGNSTLNVGESTTLTATVNPKKASNKGVVWSSSDPSVAKVTAKGVVYGIKPGKVNITATAKDGSGKKATVVIIINQKPTITITPENQQSATTTTPGNQQLGSGVNSGNSEQKSGESNNGTSDASTGSESTTEEKPEVPQQSTDQNIAEVTIPESNLSEHFLGYYYNKNEIASGVVNIDIISHDNKKMPDFIGGLPDGTIKEVRDDPENKYDKIVTLTGKSGFQCVYKIRFYYIDIESVSLIQNGVDLLTDWKIEYDTGSVGEETGMLIVSGICENITSDIQVITNRNDARIQVDGKKLLVTVGLATAEYHVNYNNIVLESYNNSIDVSFRHKQIKKGNGLIHVFELTGSEATLSQEVLEKFNSQFYVTNKNGQQVPVTAEVVDSDIPDYNKMVRMTFQNEVIRSYLKYSIDEKYFRINSVTAKKDGVDHEIKWGTSKYSKVEIGENNRILVIRGFLDALPDISVTTSYEDATVEIVDSDMAEFTKMVCVTYLGETRKYYVRYEFDLDEFFVEHVTASAIEGGKEQLTHKWVINDYDYDSKVDTLRIYGRKAEIPSNLVFTTDISGIELQVKQSDLAKYQKMVVITVGNLSIKCYIDYVCDFSSLAEEVSIEANSNGENQITYKSIGYNGEYVCKLRGKTPALPENLTISTDGSGYTAEIKASDNTKYKKMLVITVGNKSKIFYITYEYDFDFENVIENHVTVEYLAGGKKQTMDLYYPDDDESYVYLKGLLVSLPESAEAKTDLPDVTVTIENSDRDGYSKMLTVTVNGVSKHYYIDYNYLIKQCIEVSAMNNGLETIHNFYSGYEYRWDDNQDEELRFDTLNIYGSSETIPDNLEIRSQNDFTTVSMEDSDLSGFNKMLVITSGGESRKYYIQYYQSDDDDY